MINAAVQNKGFSLAGLLSNVMVQCSAKCSAQFLTNPNGCSSENWAENLTKPDMWMTTNDDIAAAQLSGVMYANVNVRSAEVSSLNTTNCDINSTESLGEYLSKPDMQSAVAGGAEGFIGVTTGGTDLKLSGLVINSEGEFCQSIKKGSIAVATPLIHKQSAKLCFGHSSVLRRCNSPRATSTSCRISSPALVPISSTRDSASRAERRCDSGLPSSWRRAISPCMAVTIKPAVDSPSRFRLSMSFNTSCGTLAVTDCDFVFVGPVAIKQPSSNWCKTVYIKITYIKALTCKPPLTKNTYTLSTGKAQEVHKTAKPRGALTPSGLLTTTVISSNEVAMSNRTTPHMGRASLRPNKFTWRFLALSAIDRNVIHITATTEREAREKSPAGCVMVFAGRLPVLEGSELPEVAV